MASGAVNSQRCVKSLFQSMFNLPVNVFCSNIPYLRTMLHTPQNRVPLTPLDYRQAQEVTALLRKIESAANDADYINGTFDDMINCQPIIHSLIGEHRQEQSMAELDQTVTLYFLVWEYFRTDGRIRTTAVSEEAYLHEEDLAVAFFQQLGKVSPGEKDRMTDADLNAFRAKALLGMILIRFETQPVLIGMEGPKKINLMVALRTLIRCFEQLGGTLS